MWILTQSGGEYSDSWERYIAVSRNEQSLLDMKDRLEKEEMAFNANVIVVKEHMNNWEIANPRNLPTIINRPRWNHNQKLTKEENKKARQEHAAQSAEDSKPHYEAWNKFINSKLEEQRSFIQGLNVSDEQAEKLLNHCWTESTDFFVSEIDEI